MKLETLGLTAPNREHPNCFGNVTNYAWADAFAEQKLERFLELFNEKCSQTASASPFITHGVYDIASTFGWASEFYKWCNFTHQATSQNRCFLEWELETLNGMHMTGMTVHTYDENGKIIDVFNGHRNLGETMIFCEHFIKGPQATGIIYPIHWNTVRKYGLEPKFERNPEGVMRVEGVTESDYINAFRKGTSEAFKAVLSENVSLSGSYVTETLHGIDDVSACLAAVADFYEHCIFTTQAACGNRTYLLYKGRLRNELVISDGFLVLVHDESGKISEVLDNPIPLFSGTVISAYLAKVTAQTITSGKYFYRKTLYKEMKKKYGLDHVFGEKTKGLNFLSKGLKYK